MKIIPYLAERSQFPRFSDFHLSARTLFYLLSSQKHFTATKRIWKLATGLNLGAALQLVAVSPLLYNVLSVLRWWAAVGAS